MLFSLLTLFVLSLSLLSLSSLSLFLSLFLPFFFFPSPFGSDYMERVLHDLNTVAGRTVYQWGRLDGSTPNAERPKLIKRFNTGTMNVLLVSTKVRPLYFPVFSLSPTLSLSPLSLSFPLSLTHSPHSTLRPEVKESTLQVETVW